MRYCFLKDIHLFKGNDMATVHIPKDKKVWFITGVSTGLGRTLSEALLAHGDYLAGTVRNAQQIEQIEQLAPGRVLCIQMDVTQDGQVQAAVEQTIKHFGQIDVLVNNAGHRMIGAIEESSDAEVRALFDVNVFGVLNVLRAALPHMRERRTGTIINMSSQGGMRSFPGSGHYCATKHALEAFSESLALELSPMGIKVLIVEPGGFRTDFAGRSMAIAKQYIPDYVASSGMRRENLKNVDGHQKGDPVRAAEAIIQAVESDHAPLRLALGAEALKGMRENVSSAMQDWSAWESVSLGADYPDE
jgi:NAD(P)-dependent dehydrogenase (short-subunit alcohol dehydrogenase family)